MKVENDLNRPMLLPPAESFSAAAVGSLAFDLEQVAKKKARDAYYKDTTGSHSALPQITPKSSLKFTTAQVDPKGKEESFLDFVYRLFWGSSKASVEPRNEESSGFPLKGTPELANYNRHLWKISQGDFERIIVALDEARKSIERIHEVVKEDYAQGTRFEDATALFAFMKILKEQLKLKNGEQLTNTEMMQALHKATKKLYDQKGDHNKALEKAQSHADTAAVVGVGASILLGAATVSQLLKFCLPTNPILDAAIQLLTTAVTGIKGATELVKVKYEKDAAHNRAEIERFQHHSEKHSHMVKDYTQSNSLIGNGLTQAMRNSAQTLERSRRLAKEASSF